MDDNSDDDDSGDNLLQISTRHKRPAIELLLDIQEEQVQQETFLRRFLSRLECFSRKRTRSLRRRRINAFKETEYVALSYTWHPSEYEDAECRRYWVQDRSGAQYFPSRVRILLRSRACFAK
ncbi:hypothetical protein F4821DRAFT_55222 [Hypoxylon rubiginosum]|uniref:Uncharacterized protein n=1 Tax=Hypoxylon rubiginosum TaxID=110542 RepID=A0ACC0CJK6_9PEZI|nr:hypothetical protein F4821DRAFT_55222 [Hypoxylon rubiginosum]